MGEFYFSSRKVKLMVLRGEEAELKLADFFLFSNVIISESSLFRVSFGMMMFDVKISRQLWSDPCAFESLVIEVTRWKTCYTRACF